MRNTRLVLLATTVAVVLLALVPLASATTLVADDFEGETLGATPTGSGYTWGADGGTPVITNAVAHGGANSVRFTSSATTTPGGDAMATTANLCTAGASFDVWLYLASLPDSGKKFGFDMDGRPTYHTFPTQLYVDSLGRVHFYISTGVSGADQIVATGFATLTWEQLTVTATCSTGHFQFTSTTLTASGGSFPRDYDSQVAPANYYTGGSGLNDFRWFYLTTGDAAVSGYDAWMDDLGTTVPAPATVVIDSPTAGQTVTVSTVGFTSHVTSGTTFSLPVDHVEYTSTISGTTYRCKGHTAPTYPCSMNLPNGAYAVTGIGQDVGEGYQTDPSASVSFTVAVPGGGSSAHLTSPALNQVVAHGASVPLAATLTDTGGTVTHLVFEVQGNGVLAQCTDSTAPYACSVVVVDGAYTATVEGRDAGGNDVAPMDAAPVAFSVGGVVAPVHTLLVPGKPLTGFDVDISGSNLVARYSTGTPGSHVITVPAQTISDITADADTGCNRVKGVTAAQVNVAFTYCSPAGASVTALKVESNTLGVPDVAAPCDNHADPSGGQSWSPGLTGLTGLESFRFGSVDYENAGVNHGGASCDLAALLGFTDTDGKVGMLILRLYGDGTQDNTVARAQYAPNGHAADGFAVCETAADTGTTLGANAYLLVVDANQPTNTYKFHNGAFNTIGSTLDTVQTGSGALGSAKAVSCSGSATATALLTTVNHVYGYHYLTGSTAWQLGSSVYAPVANGAAESWDGKWGAVCCLAGTNTIQVYGMANGTAFGNLTLPTFAGSSVVGMVMDSTGQSLWVARSTSSGGRFDEYDIHGFTTHRAVAPGCQTPDDAVCRTNPGCPSCPTSSTSTTVPVSGALHVSLMTGIVSTIATVFGFALLAFAFIRGPRNRTGGGE